jgi:hypothetical protein
MKKYFGPMFNEKIILGRTFGKMVITVYPQHFKQSIKIIR